LNNSENAEFQTEQLVILKKYLLEAPCKPEKNFSKLHEKIILKFRLIFQQILAAKERTFTNIS